MIGVLGGTSDGAALVEALAVRGERTILLAATDYRQSLSTEAEGLTERRIGRLDAAGMEAAFTECRVKAVVDATHPFAVEATDNAQRACASLGLPYLRLARASTPIPDSDAIAVAQDFEEAAELACRPGARVFLAIGAQNLRPFAARAGGVGAELIPRVLPRRESIDACLALGIPERNVVALQGPFGKELNEALLRHCRATVLVTKDSGPQGKTVEKIEAALEVGAGVILVRRPSEDSPGYCTSVEEVVESLAGRGLLCRVSVDL